MEKPLIKIYGERNTGTKILTHFIRRNLDVYQLPGVVQLKTIKGFTNLEIQAVGQQWNLPQGERFRDLYFKQTFHKNLGWKHSLVKPATHLKKISLCSKNLSFVTITKNPYSWLMSFYRRPYHQFWRKTPDFDTFLTSPWRTVGRENAPPEFPNPVELWNQKNASYFQLREQFPTLNLRYEDLLSNPGEVIESIINISSYSLKGDFVINIGSLTKTGQKGFADYQDYYLRERWKESLSPSSIKLINERLDDELMARYKYETLD